MYYRNKEPLKWIIFRFLDYSSPGHCWMISWFSEHVFAKSTHQSQQKPGLNCGLATLRSTGSHTQKKCECFHYLSEQNCYDLKLSTHIIHILGLYWYADLGTSQVYTAVQKSSICSSETASLRSEHQAKSILFNFRICLPIHIFSICSPQFLSQKK